MKSVWNELWNFDFMKLLFYFFLFVVCVCFNGLMFFFFDSYLLFKLDGFILMLILVYGLLYLFVNYDLKERILGCKIFYMFINYKLNKSW